MKKRISILIAILVISTIFAIFMVGCEEENIEGLYKPTNISYDGQRITWDRVELSEYYLISINGGEEKRVNTNVFAYESDSVTFEVTVKSVIKENTFSETITFTQLDTITDITIENDGTLRWGEVAGATGYRVSVNGSVLMEDIVDTAYTPSVGSSRIKVRAVVTGDNSYFSKWSEEKSVSIYNAPSSIKYDGKTLRWLGNARNYEVTINGQQNSVTGNEFVYASGNIDFSMAIKAVGDHVTTYDSATVEETFKYLLPITDLNVVDGILTWGNIADAEGYRIKINGVEQVQKITTNSYDKLASGTSLEISVKPYNDQGNYFSSWSETKSVYILESPETTWNSDLELDGEENANYVWNAVNGAIGYKVSIEKNGIVTHYDYPIAQTAFAYAYKDVGTYTVKVKAIAEATGDYSDSKYSLETIVERLAAPKATTENFVTSNSNVLSDGFTVSYSAVKGASGYQLYKDGVLLEGKYSNTLSISDRDVADDSISTQQEYNYIVKSMGAVKTVAGKTYAILPCLSTEALAFKITVLAMPVELNMAGFNAEWLAVSGNNGYGIKSAGNIYAATATSYDLSTLSAGTTEVSVCAKGNGGMTLASNYTAPIIINRLVAPTNIEITYGTGEGLLDFDRVTNAKSYQVYIDESTQALPENAFDNIYQYIRESGTVLHMVAEANYYNTERTIYYMTSQASPTQQFIRLAKPVFPEGAFANSVEMVWSAPDNINTAEYTPTYQVWEAGVELPGQKNGTRFNIEYLDGGSAYTFKVKAVGNNTKYLDSEFSEEITIYKLSTPTMSIENNQYVWNGVTNASAYVLEIDGKRVNDELHVSGNKYSYTPYYNQIGTHTVKLFAVGDGYTTINSGTYVYNQVVEACLAPEISYSYSNDQFVNGGSISVSITKETENNNGYLYEIAGENVTSKELTETKPIESAGTYTIKVKALGGKIDENEIYYVDSQYVGGSSGYKIILLAPPTLGTFSLNSDGAIKWATVSNALGYDYQIAYDDGEYSEVLHTGTPTLDPIENYKEYGTIKIRVKVCGNGNSIISSEWIEYVWDNPLK